MSSSHTKLTTCQAASYMAAATSDFDTDWYNVLQENRRETFSFSKMYGVKKKSNRHRYSWLYCVRVGGHYVYAKDDIDQWLLDELKILAFMPKHAPVTPTLLNKVQSFAVKHGIII